jgi:hypothetical protein
MDRTFNEILDALEPDLSERVPKSLRPFLFRERPPSGFTQSLPFFAFGFEYAFQHLVTEAVNRWPHDYLHVPVFFLARHSIELHLKRAISEAANYSTIEADLTGHRLLPLWQQLLNHASLAGLSVDDEYTAYCGKLINHLHEADPDSERFRYPTAKGGQQFKFTRIELDGLIKAHFHITTYCDGIVTTFDGFSN